jgi:hypothetical protein
MTDATASQYDYIRQSYIQPIRSVILVDDEFPTFRSLVLATYPDPVEDASADDAPRNVAAGTPDEVVDVTELPAPRQPDETSAGIVAANVAVLPTASRGDAEEAARHSATSAEGRSASRRALVLWEYCRKRGWTCDVESNLESPHASVDNIAKNDLIILDYHLAPANNPLPALALLRSLASSDGAHMVVVYTNDRDIAAVARRIAAHLRGTTAIEQLLHPHLRSLWETIPVTETGIDYDDVELYIQGILVPEKVEVSEELRLEFEMSGVPARCHGQMRRARLESYLRNKMFVTSEPSTTGPVRLSTAGSTPWVKQGNLFVAVAQKGDIDAADDKEPQRVIDELQNALKESKPSLLEVTLSYARGVISQGGFRADATALKQPMQLAGWWYHVLSGPTDELTDRLSTLYERVLDGLVGHVLQRVGYFGGQVEKYFSEDIAKALSEAGGDSTKAALALAHAQSEQPWHVVHALNEFLCSDPVELSHVTTGTVFQIANGSADHAWICVAPACDMVPRKPRSPPWLRDLDPIRPMLAASVQLFNISEDILKIAERGRHAFISVENIPKEIHLVGKQTGLPKLEMLFAGDQANLTPEGMFVGYRVEQENAKPLFSNPIKFKVLGRLREAYASRLLSEVGRHLTRIGVDFVDLPGAVPIEEE